ncbi:MAG: hypothetical protein RL699_629 [Bacteroidota bacterium]|jgi:uncharacterized protein YktA (UPF0223 family)
MKIVLLFWFIGMPCCPGFGKTMEENPNAVIWAMTHEIKTVRQFYEQQIQLLEFQMRRHLVQLQKANQPTAVQNEMAAYLVSKAQIQALELEQNNEITKIKYLKGLQIIKLLYEKVLGLDHHFASSRSFQELNNMANPNQYKEFIKFKEVVQAKREKKSLVDLPALLSGNTIISVVQSVTNLVNSSISKEEKEKELAAVACLLDFSLRMQSDLNTIYFETAYLQSSNLKIKQDIELLFKEYTKPIGYSNSLEGCRTSDDWEVISQKTEEYLQKMKSNSGVKQYKLQINMEFPVDRLLQFIAQYNNFIDQGAKHYEKFKIIVNSYENEKQCEVQLPAEYKKLKSDIDFAIEKFNVAYKPVEINGTKMKEILYGLNEFD